MGFWSGLYIHDIKRQEILESVAKILKEIAESKKEKNKNAEPFEQDYSLLPKDEFFDLTKPVSFNTKSKKESK